MDRRPHSAISVLVAGATLAAFVACSGSSNNGGMTGTNTTPPPQAVQSEVASAVASEVASQVQSLTNFGLDPFLVSLNRVSNHRTAVAALSQLMKHRTHRLDTGDCPTVTPPDPTDTDGDGIPDSVTYTFTAANCTLSSEGTTLVYSGGISIADATPTIPGLAYRESINNINLQETSSSEDVTVTYNGSVAVGETLSSITEAVNYTFGAAVTGTSNGPENLTFAENLTETYSFPATNTLLVEGDALPAGTLTLTGSETVTLNSTVYNFTVSTPTALSVDQGCATAITAGVITVTFTGNASGADTITWTSCGVYTVTAA